MTPENPFQFNLEPVADSRRQLTFTLSISIYGKVAWPVAGEADVSIEIQLDDLFAYLVEFWRPLLLRQTYPLGLTPMRPSLVLRDAAAHWEGQPESVIEEEAETVASFEEAHDLSRAFGGLFDLPHFWMFREADRMLCDTGRHLFQPPFQHVRKELVRLGNWIAAYLAELDGPKWDRVVQAWNARDDVTEVDLVAWSASLELDVAAALIKNGSLDAPHTLEEATNDNDQLLIAARMAGALPAEQIADILAIAKSFKGHQALALDEVSKHCLAVLEQLPKATQPHGQGEAIAREVRAFRKIGPSERIDIFDLVRDLGVEIQSQGLDPATFDGLAIGGGRFGPGAFINEESQRVAKDVARLEENAGARVTLSHELCHLLVDRHHPLSAVEVLRSRMPASVEARAKAFAGELLLPTFAAADFWDRAGSPTEPEKLQSVLQDLANHFGVSFSVAAWKLEHGSGETRRRLKPVLDTLAPYR